MDFFHSVCIARIKKELEENQSGEALKISQIASHQRSTENGSRRPVHRVISNYIFSVRVLLTVLSGCFLV